MALLSAANNLVSGVSKVASSLYYGGEGKGGNTGVPAIGAAYKAVATNLTGGKLLTSIPISPKYEGTAVGTLGTIATKPLTLIAAALAPAAVIHSSAISATAAPILGNIGTKSLSLATAGGKALITNPIGSLKTVGTTSALAFGGSVVLRSQKAQDAIIKLPAAANNLSKNTAAFVDNPSIDTAKKLIKDNPLLVGILGGTAVTGLALTFGPTIANYLSLKATNRNTAADNRNSKIIEESNALAEKMLKDAADAKKEVAAKEKQTALDELAAVNKQIKDAKAERKAAANAIKKQEDVIPGNPIVPSPPTGKPTTPKKKKAKKKAKPKKKGKKYIKKKAKKKKR